MPKIVESVFVKSAYSLAPQFLQDYWKKIESEHDGKVILDLEASLPDVGVPADVKLAKRAVADFAPIPDENHLEYHLAVKWVPEGSGPHPTFVGLFIIGEDEDYGSCRLSVVGEYKPPLGAVGILFDAAVGRQIARATVRKLLYQLRDFLESRYVLEARHGG